MNTKEWVRVARPANGPTIVTVTLVEDNLTAKWSVKAYGNIRTSVGEARTSATAALAELKEAVA